MEFVAPQRHRTIIDHKIEIQTTPSSNLQFFVEFTLQDLGITSFLFPGEEETLLENRTTDHSESDSESSSTSSPTLVLEPNDSSSWSDLRAALTRLELDLDFHDQVMSALRTRVDTILADIADQLMLVTVSVKIRRSTQTQFYSPFELLRRLVTRDPARRLVKVEAQEALMLSDDKCAICLEGLGVPENSAVKVPCKHVFHQGCITKWFKKSFLCPLCRSSCL